MFHLVLYSQHPTHIMPMDSAQEIITHSFNICVLSSDSVMGYILDNKETVMNSIKFLPL